MYNFKAVKKAKQKIWLYFIELAKWKVSEMWVREIHRKYKVSPQVIKNNLDKSFYEKVGNKKNVVLSEVRKKEVLNFADNIGKDLVKNRDKKLNEILFYTFNEIEIW